jgi:hypothetical protein
VAKELPEWGGGDLDAVIALACESSRIGTSAWMAASFVRVHGVASGLNSDGEVFSFFIPLNQEPCIGRQDDW